MKTIEPTPLAAIFDLDGTLADTFPLIVSAWNAAMREPMGRDYAPEEVIARFGPPEWEMVSRELAGRNLDPQGVVEAFHVHYEAAHGTVSAFEGVNAMLEAIARSGLPMGVMTGKGRTTLDITLRRLGWEGFFGSTVTGDETERPKPDPEGVLKVARELGVPPERCVFVGDSPPDMQAGQAAGMATIAAAWHSVFLDALPAESPDYWVENPLEVLALLGIPL